MAAAVRLRDDFDAARLRGLAKASRDPDQLRRLLSLAEICDGGSRGDAARIFASTPVGRALLAPIFLRYRIDLHPSAHDQNFQRTFPVFGDPDCPQIALEDPGLYEKGAGVIYAKVSPSGKRSEIGHGFSKLPDEKADYLPARNDTAHQYALITVSDEAREVQVRAVHPDGRPDQTINQFRIQKPSARK
jgi:hypothetical protein